MTTLAQDLKYALRVLRNSPGFAAAAILVLALGIGANTAIFSVVNAVLLRPLPFRDSSRLVQVWHVPPAKSFPGMTRFSVSAANYLDWQQQNQVFEQMAIYSFSSFNFTASDQPEAIQGAGVSPDFFSALRSQPLLGRTFLPEEDQPGRGHVVILSHAIWKSHFAGNRNVIGQNIIFDNETYTVVGVMGPNFRFPDWAKVWTPMAWTDAQRQVRGEHHFLVIARLKSGVPLLQAQAEMNTIRQTTKAGAPSSSRSANKSSETFVPRCWFFSARSPSFS
jgi:putative ABC transport system permease protein